MLVLAQITSARGLVASPCLNIPPEGIFGFVLTGLEFQEPNFQLSSLTQSTFWTVAARTCLQPQERSCQMWRDGATIWNCAPSPLSEVRVWDIFFPFTVFFFYLIKCWEWEGSQVQFSVACFSLADGMCCYFTMNAQSHHHRYHFICTSNYVMSC